MKPAALLSLALPFGTLLLQQSPRLNAQTMTYDLTADYRIDHGNPNGVWSYGWMPIGFGTFNLLTNNLISSSGNLHWAGWNYDYTPGIWKNLGASAYGVPTDWLSLHPGPGQEPIVLRWTAPDPSPVDVIGQFLPGDGGAMQVAVRFNGQPWWSASDSGSFSLHTNVLAGDTIDFTVYGGYAYGNTPLTAVVTTIPLRLQLAREDQINLLNYTAPTDGMYVLESTKTLTPPIQWTGVITNHLITQQVFSFSEESTNETGFYRVRRD